MTVETVRNGRFDLIAKKLIKSPCHLIEVEGEKLNKFSYGNSPQGAILYNNTPESDVYRLVMCSKLPAAAAATAAQFQEWVCGEVLKDIHNLLESNGFTRANFRLSEYIDSTGRTLPMYIMSRDGFVLLPSLPPSTPLHLHLRTQDVDLVLFPRLAHVKAAQEATTSIVLEQGVREVVRMEGAFPDVVKEVLHGQTRGHGVDDGDGNGIYAVKDVLMLERGVVFGLDHRNHDAAPVSVLAFKALILRSLRYAKKAVGGEDLDNISFRVNHAFALEDVQGVCGNHCGIHDFHQSLQRQPATETLSHFRQGYVAVGNEKTPIAVPRLIEGGVNNRDALSLAATYNDRSLDTFNCGYGV